MGEMADFALNEVMDYEDLRLAYHMGGMSDVEAFEHGLIDPLGYEYSYIRTKSCRCCGKQGLVWGSFNNKWLLFEDDKPHLCPVNPHRSLIKEA